ncbi:hypothetical protein J2S43_007844 [Catenuloplanes nepalensis]|uniref:Uncharacterized protein n=1 Tax=Catenuloplanes nepalensis TaxID=587533 RepID=A0ABT9N6K8_9ACTN|nr:hypothetical protein [Catenuloplanes nepalensis]
MRAAFSCRGPRGSPTRGPLSTRPAAPLRGRATDAGRGVSRSGLPGARTAPALRHGRNGNGDAVPAKETKSRTALARPARCDPRSDKGRGSLAVRTPGQRESGPPSSASAGGACRGAGRSQASARMPPGPRWR